MQRSGGVAVRRVIPRKPWLLCGEVDGKPAGAKSVIAKPARGAAGVCDSFAKRI
jgi:hypothetical protein